MSLYEECKGLYEAQKVDVEGAIGRLSNILHNFINTVKPFSCTKKEKHVKMLLFLKPIKQIMLG